MVHEESIALEVDAGQYSQHLESLFLIDAKPAEGHTMEELEAVISEELERLADEGPTTAELERAVNQLEVDFLRNLESLQARASALNRYQALVGDPGWIDRDLARYREVTAADVQHICRTHLSSARRAIIRVHPEDSP
jgi:zinc protease